MATKEFLTLAQASRTFPGNPHLSTIWRYASKGIKGVRLRVIKAGGKTLTTKSWIDDFIQELSSPNQGGTNRSGSPHSPARKSKITAQLESELNS